MYLPSRLRIHDEMLGSLEPTLLQAARVSRLQDKCVHTQRRPKRGCRGCNIKVIERAGVTVAKEKRWCHGCHMPKHELVSSVEGQIHQVQRCKGSPWRREENAHLALAHMPARLLGHRQCVISTTFVLTPRRIPSPSGAILALQVLKIAFDIQT